MKFVELVQKYVWNDLYPALLQLYPDQEKSLEGYRQVFETLQSLTPVETKMRVYIERVHDEITDEDYDSVCGKDGTLIDDTMGNQEVTYAIEFTDWAEWLGMDIDPETLSNYTEVDILAHCLWEMTFFAYSREDIKKVMAEIKHGRRDVERFSLAEVKQELDLNSGTENEETTT